MNQQMLTSHCQHTVLANGIHIFTVLNASNQAIDEWISYLDAVYNTVPAGQTVRYMIDYKGNGLPFLTYGSNRIKQWFNRRPEYPTTRIAVLYRDSALIPIISRIIRLLRVSRITVYFFHADQYEQAVGWLLRDTPASTRLHYGEIAPNPLNS